MECGSDVLQLHEDYDILGRFSPEVYTWTTPGKGLAQVGMFVATVFGLCGVVYMFYPDKPAVPRAFPHNGLEKALGGPGNAVVGAHIPSLSSSTDVDVLS